MIAVQRRFFGFLHIVGTPVHEQVATFFEGIAILGQVLTLLPQRKAWRFREIFLAISHMGASSLPIVCVSTVCAGLMITDELAWHMDVSLHSIGMIPGFTGQFILRELGVAIPSMLLVSKVGAAITAEVGTMKITEQIDALRLLRIDPVAYLVFPRFLAGMISGVCLTAVASAVTVACAMLVAVASYNFSVMEYINALKHFVGAKDILCGLFKGVFAGCLIPLVSCAYGFRCRGGAEGVGLATTNSVVSASIIIVGMDFVLTYLFTLIQ